MNRFCSSRTQQEGMKKRVKFPERKQYKKKVYTLPLNSYAGPNLLVWPNYRNILQLPQDYIVDSN